MKIIVMILQECLRLRLIKHQTRVILSRLNYFAVSVHFSQHSVFFGCVLSATCENGVCIMFLFTNHCRIQLAITLLQEAAACITAMVGLPFYCLVQACGFVGFSAIWLFYTTYLVSSADITTKEDPVTGASYKEYEYSDRAKQSVC